jgi:hypothetical protein
VLFRDQDTQFIGDWRDDLRKDSDYNLFVTGNI